jgi:hypothetical protein
VASFDVLAFDRLTMHEQHERRSSVIGYRAALRRAMAVARGTVEQDDPPACLTPHCPGNPALSGLWNGRCQQCNGEA